MPRTKTQSSGRNEFALFKQPRSPFFSIRVMVRGQRRKFSTGESTITAARRKATVIMADIKSRGFDAAIQLHSRRNDRLSTDPDLDEFADIYRQALVGCESPPARPTVEYYIRSLKLICLHAGISRLSQLNRSKIDHFVKVYQHKALAEGRDPDSVKTSINSWLRNGAAMFSQHALESYARQGMQLENPFKGTRLRRVTIPGYSPLQREVLDQIWKEAPLLRDGDPNAGEPVSPKRWQSHDFRKPQPEAYAILLLELGLGLRRKEADKAQWDWIRCDTRGRFTLEVKITADFKPKSKKRRVIPLDKALHTALIAGKKDDIFIVAGPRPRSNRRRKEPKNSTYRCDRSHRLLVAWLRNHGVCDAKPCHLLRKEFGSYVATSFSLFHAQQFLGHSSPSVTSAYYAGLTGLPELNSTQLDR